jgi:phage host-nuclease inhibitor protein Gam
MTPITNITDLRNALDLAARERILANSIKAEMDAKIAAVHAKHDDTLKGHAEAEAAYLKLAQKWAAEHRTDLLPKGIKTAKVGAHELGWEDNGGAVKMRKGTTEKKVVARMLASKLSRLFVRHTPALDKTAIAAKWAAFGEKLKKLGVTYKHEEIFFVKLDITETPDARVTPEA